MKKTYCLMIVILSMYITNYTSDDSGSYPVTEETLQAKEARLNNIIGIAHQKAIEMGINQEDLLKYTVYAWSEQHGGKFDEKEIDEYLAQHDSPSLVNIIQQGYEQGKRYSERQKKT